MKRRLFWKKYSLKIFLGASALLLISLFSFFYGFYFYQPPKTYRWLNRRSAPIVFFLAHQDDEMFLAGSLVRAVASGRIVYIILVTDGSKSQARFVINGVDANNKPVFDSLLRRVHNPVREGYQPLDATAFSRARNKEFFASITALGVPEDHIWFANPGGVAASDNPVYINDELSSEQANEVIKNIFSQVGNGTYVTLAAELGALNKEHGDHLALQQALLSFKDIEEKRFYSEKIGRGSPLRLSVFEMEERKRALQNYGIWKPREGRFAVGEHSVVTLIRTWTKNPFEYVFDDKDLAKK